jgi:hypothetical protein
MDEELKKALGEIDARASLGEQESPDTEFEGGTSGPRTSNYTPQYLQMMQQKQEAAAPGEQASKLGSLATTAGMLKAGGASANPYILAAGLGLQALGNMSASKYKEEVRRQQAKQEAAQNMANIGRSLRVV